MVQDLSYNLCESLVENIDGVAGVGKKTPPTPITYLTQWKIVGNSDVHTDPYLTSWKVSGNSVVDNNTILSCGDLGQDGKYHVKISNGVIVYDIPLDAPLRKVNDVADTIEFPSDTDGKALVIRNLALLSVTKFVAKIMDSQNKLCLTTSSFIGANYNQNEDGNILCNKIENGLSLTNARVYNGVCFAMQSSNIWIRNGMIEQTVESYQSYFDSLGAIEVVYELATPTTELIDVSPFPISATDTYTSANVVPYSAFEHTENKEIWSCGEYNATDGKYHILVQPLEGSIVDIALNEPLRKVNDVADKIEFANEIATVTRYFGSKDMDDIMWNNSQIGTTKYYRMLSYDLASIIKKVDAYSVPNILTPIYTAITSSQVYNRKKGIGVVSNGNIVIYDDDYNQSDSEVAFTEHVDGVELIYELATPTTELVDAPQIQEAESYSCVISQGGKAVEWSSFYIG